MYYPELYPMQNSLYGADLQKKIQCSGCQSAPSYDLRAWKPGKNPLHFRRRRVDIEKNGPLCWWKRGRADSYPKSFPCRSVAQTQLHGQQMWCAERRVTPCQLGHQKSVCQQKKYRFTQKCLATTGSRVLSASLKTFACPWVIPVSNRSSYWWKAPRFLIGISASDAKCNQNIM